MIITLVGSVKQEADWRRWVELLTTRGHMVFEAGRYGTVGKDILQEDWDKITKVHHEKIEHSNLVLVIPKPEGSTFGEHTKADIDHAKKYGIPVFSVFDYDSRLMDVIP